MKTLVFDTSSVISIAMNDLLWVLKELKIKFNGEFYIPSSVKLELVDKPLQTNKFKLEAIMVRNIIQSGNLKVYNELDVEEILRISNNIYSVNNRSIHILDRAEVEALALAIKLNAEAYVVDERTIRLLVENHHKLQELLQSKLHTRVDINEDNVKKFKEMTGEIPIIRSTELLVVAMEKGLLDKYSKDKKELIEALLWGLRLRGCAISTEEIEDIVKLESK